jgi:hypothetical protein
MKYATELSKSMVEIIDYAGLFPPAALASGDAINEFFAQSKDAELNWLFRRFVLPFAPVPRCQEIIAGLRQAAGEAGKNTLPDSWGGGVPVSVLLPSLEASKLDNFADLGALGAALASAASSFQNGLQLMREAAKSEEMIFAVEAVEWALPLDDERWNQQHTVEAQGALRAMRDLVPNLKIYIEASWQNWSPGLLSRMKDLVCEDALTFCKIRTGGLAAASIPPSPALARVLSDLVAADIGFKCTAGLHSALFETSPRFGFDMHGFVNLICATAGLSAGLKERDIVPLLALRRADQLMDRLEEKLGSATGAALARARHFMHSFGSCSVSEPRDSLKLIGI